MKTRLTILLLALLFTLLITGCTAVLGPLHAHASLQNGWLSILITNGARTILDQVACLPGCIIYPIP